MKKHILCLGDSNTHGYCGDPDDSEDKGLRYTENERWTCLLQKALGDDYLIIEEGLNGRTTVFADPVRETADALSIISPLLNSHKNIDLLIIMLGTNDTKDRFNVSAPVIARGMEQLIRKAMSVDCWGVKTPNILIIAPAPIEEGFMDPMMGEHCVEKSRELAKYYEEVSDLYHCHFLDGKGLALNQVDFIHLSKKGHQQLAERLTRLIPDIV